jgi:hypothetical protein
LAHVSAVADEHIPHVAIRKLSAGAQALGVGIDGAECNRFRPATSELDHDPVAARIEGLRA